MLTYIHTFSNWKNYKSEEYLIENVDVAKLDSMSDTQLYDYFYNLVKKSPDSYIKELKLKSKPTSPATLSKLYQVDVEMLITFLESVKKGDPIGFKNSKEKSYMGKRFKTALYIISGLGQNSKGSVMVNGKEFDPYK